MFYNTCGLRSVGYMQLPTDIILACPSLYFVSNKVNTLVIANYLRSTIGSFQVINRSRVYSWVVAAIGQANPNPVPVSTVLKEYWQPGSDIVHFPPLKVLPTPWHNTWFSQGFVPVRVLFCTSLAILHSLLTLCQSQEYTTTMNYLFLYKWIADTSPFHNWDEKPLGTLQVPCFCHKPHLNPLTSTDAIQRNGRVMSTTCTVWAWATAWFMAWNDCPISGIISQVALRHIRWCKGQT